MSEQRCDYTEADDTVCGRQCNELAEWWFNNQADDSDYEEFTACSKHLADMLERDVEYIVRSVKE